jgi:hypothetical protein
MTILYRGPGARITHEVFEAQTPYPQSYVIRELRYVHVIRETVADVAVGSTSFRVCSTALTGISAAFTAAGSPVFDSPPTTVVAALVAAASSVLSVQGWRLHSRPRTIWAIHRGQLVCLFTSHDRHEFGQVRRALLRALEWIEDSR